MISRDVEIQSIFDGGLTNFLRFDKILVFSESLMVSW